MSQSGFQVLAEIYRFLGQFDGHSLAAASRVRGISENLRRALMLLAKESRNSRPKSEKRRRSLVGTGKLPFSPVGAADEALQSPAARGRIKRELSTHFSDNRRFPSKQSLVEFARRQGIEIAADPKWAKTRLIGKLAAAFVADPEALDRLATDAAAQADPQTSGWIDLIRRSSK